MNRNDGLRWGYTLLDLHDMTRMSLARNIGIGTFTRAERYDIAWTAIATALYETGTAPDRSDLIYAGWRAVSEARTTEMRHHGIDHTRHVGEGRPRFATYWTRLPEDAATDRLCEVLALYQIWPALTDGQQEALAALAAFGNATLAAGGIGKTTAALHRLTQQGRKRFKALWFEGEEVPPPWGRDTRAKDPDAAPDPRRARTAIKKRARKALHERTHA